MRLIINCLFIGICSLVINCSPVHAYELEQTGNTSTTATVPNTIPTTNDTTPPSNPILISPTDGSATGDNQPEFVWKRSTDPNGNVVVYTLYLNGVATYLGISNIGNSTGNGFSARVDGLEIKLKVNIPIVDGNYNWYVTAEDGSGNTSYSTTWNLTIDTVAPHILITDIDIYHNLLLDSNNPENFTDLSFDIAGPKAVNFTIVTEPWSTLALDFYDIDGKLVQHSSWPINSQKRVYPSVHLDIGRYRVSVTSFDRGSNTTALPDFYLIISQAHISITIPGKPTTPLISIPYTPLIIPSLRAAISNIQTKQVLPYLIYTLLAIGITLLLIFLWKKRFNLYLIDEHGHPIKHATIYHSIPTTRSKLSQVLVTKFAPISYLLTKSDQGYLYIPHLTRYSTLTIRLENITYILSISTKQRTYKIIL